MIYDHECYLKCYLEDLIGREDVYVTDTETSGFDKKAEVLAVTVLDTCAKARPRRPRGLAAAAADLGIRAHGVHTALGDATTTLRVARALAGVRP